ncbi:hypothetical protein V6N13_015079 [Hibiscus sabdariffa]
MRLEELIANRSKDRKTIVELQSIRTQLWQRVRRLDSDIQVLSSEDSRKLEAPFTTEEIWNVVRILKGFKLVSGLKLNQSKSKVLGINVEESKLVSWDDMIHCSRENFPFVPFALSLLAGKQTCYRYQGTLENYSRSVDSKFFLLNLAKWPNMGSSVTDLSSNLHNLSYIRNRSIEVNQKSWISPRTGQLKFNMDGVVRGSFGDASIAV